MVHVNFATQEVSCKLVYCGPGLSGKTTNLQFIHDRAPEDRKGELCLVATRGDRTLFFDYLPLTLGQVAGRTTRFAIYTVPGQAYYAATRRLVLQGADGLVFVADSAPERLDDNLASLEELGEFTREVLERELDEMPLILQWNKRDHPHALPVAELERRLNPRGRPSLPAVARSGVGVLATLKQLSRLVLTDLQRRQPPADETGQYSVIALPPSESDDSEPEEAQSWACPWSSADEPDPGDGIIGQQVGGCRIHTKLGEGGMGAVYLARHEGLDKDLVVKVLKPGSGPGSRRVRRFFREARLAARLEHPNIVAIQDVGTNKNGLHYIVMEYVEGENLHERIDRKGRHSPRKASAIVLAVARALGALHEAGVIHRDVKAANVVLTSSGVVKLIDFGLAKDLEADGALTLPGARVGTPAYMAPEIGRVEEVDGRADIYSLGLTYYYLLTGQPPFAGEQVEDILRGKVRLAPPPASIGGACLKVLARALAWDREERYATVAELTGDLEAVISQHAIQVHPAPHTLWRATGPRPRTPRPVPPPPSSSGSAVVQLPPPVCRRCRGHPSTDRRVRLLQVALGVAGVLVIALLLALQSATARADREAARWEALMDRLAVEDD